MSESTLTETSEKDYQNFIAEKLIQSQNFDAETQSSDFSAEFCFNTDDVLNFIKKTQFRTFEALERMNMRSFLVQLNNTLKEKGIVEVLRKGIQHKGRKIELFYPKPNSIFNRDTEKLYEANHFSITQNLTYSPKKNNTKQLDICIFLNGFPIITITFPDAEQAIEEAIQQYKTNRNPKERIFVKGRCMAHFIMDKSRVFYTTELVREATTFLPYKVGAGENELAEGGASFTAFMYEEILTKESLANIVEKYATLTEAKDKKTRQVKTTQLFPNFSQLKTTRQLLQRCRQDGLGVEHIISGLLEGDKNEVMVWLSHQLTGLYQSAGEELFFDYVVMVTDNLKLQEKIRQNIRAFELVRRYVETLSGKPKDIRALDRSERDFSVNTHIQLAFNSRKKIIICPTSFFSEVLDEMVGWKNKRMAVLVDGSKQLIEKKKLDNVSFFIF